MLLARWNRHTSMILSISRTPYSEVSRAFIQFPCSRHHPIDSCTSHTPTPKYLIHSFIQSIIQSPSSILFYSILSSPPRHGIYGIPIPRNTHTHTHTYTHTHTHIQPHPTLHPCTRAQHRYIHYKVKSFAVSTSIANLPPPRQYFCIVSESESLIRRVPYKRSIRFCEEGGGEDGIYLGGRGEGGGFRESYCGGGGGTYNDD